MADGSLRTEQPWTTVEETRLRKAWALGGIKAARQALPGRADSSIRNKAAKLKLRAPGAVDDPARLARIQRLDEDILATYAKGLKWGDIKRICERNRATRPVVYARVRALGLPPAQIKEKPWSKEEIQLLEDTAHLGVNNASRRFRNAGFRRSPGAIQQKRTRQEMCIRMAKDDRGLRTIPELAELLGVTGTTVRAWVLDDLPAEKRGEGQGGHYLIKESDLRRWIIDHPLRINLARIPHAAHPWFITMVAGA